MIHHAEPWLAGVSTIGAAVGASVPTDPSTIEALAKWPSVVVLAAVAIYSIYSMNKQSETHARTAEKQAGAIEALAKELHERPCVRSHAND